MRFDFKPVKVESVEDDEYGTIIYIFGQLKNNKTVLVKVRDFCPHVYLELPNDIAWTSSRKQLIKKKINTILGKSENWMPQELKIVMRKKSFYANVQKDDNGNYKEKKFPFLYVSYKGGRQCRSLYFKISKLSNTLRMIGLGQIKVKVHEHNANPVLQFFSKYKLKHGGWNSADGKKISECSKISSCDYEFLCKHHAFRESTVESQVAPMCMSFDIECNSSRIKAIPDAKLPGDVIFQISIVFYRMGERDESKWQKILLSLGNPVIKKKEKIKVITYYSEGELITGFKDLILELNPQTLIGYNILSFDIPYIIERARFKYVLSEFQRIGCLLGKKSPETTIKWKSDAFGEQEFTFLDAHGRLFIDLLPIVKRSYKFSTYKLGVVAQHLIGTTKDPLTPEGIFKCYRMGMRRTKKGNQALGICGKYCVTDSVTVARLSNVLSTWIDLSETASACNVPLLYLYTKGQQIRFFSLFYKKASHENYVIEHDAYTRLDNEHYSGATVIDPIPGVYDWVAPFDFASLYPTTMISNNISTETLVNDTVKNDIPDSECNVCEWEDHIGCSHDTQKRATKPKNIVCSKFRYRFIKSFKGLVARSLEEILLERSKEKKKKKGFERKLREEKLSEAEKSSLLILIDVADKRQLALKIVANSFYGALGANVGFILCLPCAMCTTAWGRKSLDKAVEIIGEKYGGKLIYGDTDSTMVQFPHIKQEELWKYCLRVDKLLEKEFPAPMKLEFEDKIYKKFLIFSKKRYIAHVVKEDINNIVSVLKKGVLLARRDNCKSTTRAYKTVVDMVFAEKSKEDILDYVNKYAMKLFTTTRMIPDFIITKKVGELDSYKIPILPKDDPVEMKRLLDLKKCSDEETYITRCLPAQVSLAVRMRKRGLRVDPGTRLEFVITNRGGIEGKQWEKIEDPKYVEKYPEILHVCPYYYLKKIVNPVDQVFEVCFNSSHDTLRVYKMHVQKSKICKELRNKFLFL